VTERPPQAALIAGEGDDVDVVRHQAPVPDLDARPQGGFGQQIEIERTVAIREENGLAPIATLRGVVGNAGKHDAGEVGDTRSLCIRRSAATCRLQGAAQVGRSTVGL